MKYEVIVVGAGMVGTSIAWHLQNNNSAVLLIDKKAPGSETSYGNAGLIQREAIHVHPFPRKLNELLRVLPNNSPDVRYRWSGVLRHWNALLKYWSCSDDEAVNRIEQEWFSLIQHCTDEHGKMIEAAGADNLIRKVGWIEMHRSQDKFNDAVQSAKGSAQQGIEHEVLTLEALCREEPNANLSDFKGAIHWHNSWQVTNPGSLVKAYARNFEKMGGQFTKGDVNSLSQTKNGWQVVTNDAVYHCHKVVIAAGPWSTQLTKPLGYSFPLFPMRGYHQHFKVDNEPPINHSLVDMDNGFVIGPMQQGIRVTTGAEMTTIDSPKNFDQINVIVDIVKQMIDLGAAVEAEAWCGSRPCMPDMKPVIGPAYKHNNLWFAFGHGHQGFTLGAITGRMIEEMIHGKPIIVDPEPFSCQRFR